MWQAIRKALSITNGNLLTDLAVWAVLLMPVLVYPSIEYPFTFGRYIELMFIVAVLALGVALAGRAEFTRHWWRSPIVWLALAWLVVTIVAGILGENPMRSLWGSVSRAMGVLFWCGLATLGLLMLTVVREHRYWLKIFSAISWVGTISAIYGLLQLIQFSIIGTLGLTTARIGGLMGNPIFLGQLLLLTIFITIYFIAQSRGWYKWAYLGGLILQLVALLLTASKGPILAVVVGLAVWGVGYLVIVGRQSVRLRGPVLWASGIGLVAVTMAGWLLWGTVQRVFNLAATSDSVFARVVVWQSLWEAWLDRPWLGYGVENVRSAFVYNYQSGLAVLGANETIVDRAHNFIIDQLATNGIIGLVLMMLVLVSVVWVLLRAFNQARRDQDIPQAGLTLALLATLVAYVVANLFAFDVVTTAIYGGVIMSGVVFITLRPQVSVGERWHLVWVVPALFALLIIDFKYLVPAWDTAKYIDVATTARRAGRYAEAFQAYAKSHEVGTDNPYRWPLNRSFPSLTRQYAIQLLDEGQGQYVPGVLADGLRVLDNIRQIEPDRVGLFIDYPLIYSLLSYSDPTALDTARQKYEELIAEFPNYEYTYLNWARALMGVGHNAEAVAVLDRASQLPTPPKELELWQAVALIQSDSSDADRIAAYLQKVVERQVNFFDGDETLLRGVVAYLFEREQWATALYFQKHLVRLASSDPDHWLILATLYQNIGAHTDAKIAAQTMLELDPSRFETAAPFL